MVGKIFLNLDSTLQNISDQENTVLKLYLRGVTDQEIRNELESFAANYTPNFMFFDINMDESLS